MGKEVYTLIRADNGKTIFSYQTNMGNVKKAYFNSEKLAKQAIEKYIQPKYDTEIVLNVAGNSDE